MPTERVTIVVTENGSRQVVRAFDAIGDRAAGAARQIRVLQNAFFVLGAAGLVRGLTRQLDTLTNYENRLRLTASSAEEAGRVQTALFEVARRSRTEFESVAEIYSRTALSVRELGVSQEETLRFTESLAKATIVSGASAREANAALVQLAQGLASNRLSGDELRSVLEQLPFVADVIARKLKVTRGELRQFGKEGKISAGVVLAAFRDAREEIDEKFANTAVTIAQAFTIARTNFQEFLDTFDDATGISSKIAKAIIVVSENLEGIVNAAALAGSALLAVFAGNLLGRIGSYIKGIRDTVVATRAAAAAEITRRDAIFSTLTARKAQTADTVLQLRQEGSLLLSKQRLLQAEVAAARFTVQGNVARNVQTGQYVSLQAATARLTAAQAALQRTEFALVNTERALTVERGRLTAVTNAATVASGRLTAAQAASTAGLARFGALGRTVQLALRGVGVVLSGVIALLGGPITAAIAAVGALSFAFVRWGNDIKVSTSAGLIGLRDIAQATFELIGEKLAAVRDLFARIFGGLADIARTAFGALGIEVGISTDFFKDAWGTAIDVTLGIFFGWADQFIGVVAGLFNSFGNIPAAFQEIWQKAVNLALQAIAFFVNKAIAGLNKVVGLINGIAEFAGLGGRLDLFEGIDVPEAFDGSGAADRFVSDFVDGYNANNSRIQDAVKGTLSDLGGSITDRARRIRDARDEDAAFSVPVKPGATTPTTSGSGGGGSKKATFASELALLRKQIEIEKEFGLQKLKNQEIFRIEKKLKRDLTETEKALVSTTVEAIEQSKIQGQVLEQINGPAEKFRLTQQALNDLYEQGAINLGQMNDKLRELYATQQEAQGTVFGGFNAAIANSIKGATDFGKAIGNEVVGAVDGLADAFVEFAKTGKLNIRAVFQSLFANLAKLAAQQLLLRLLGGFLGVPGGGLIGGAIGGGGLLGFNTGGSILPSGPGSTDSQIVAFAKRPDERVDVLTPRQQRQQSQAMAGQGGIQVIQAPAPNVVVQITPDDIADAVSGTDAGDRIVVRGLERNATAARATLAG